MNIVQKDHSDIDLRKKNRQKIGLGQKRKKKKKKKKKERKKERKLVKFFM